MKKYSIVLLLLFSVSCVFAVKVKVKNGLEQDVVYKINQSKVEGWKTLRAGESETVTLKSSKNIVVTWREGETVFVTEKLNKLAEIIFISGGRYDKAEKNWLGIKSKLVREVFLFSYKPLPKFLDAKIREEFLLPLEKLEEGLEKVKEFMEYYEKKVEENKSLVTQYALFLKSVQNQEEEKGFTKEKELAEKRVEAYEKEKEDLQKIEQELLVREVIEKYKKTIMEKEYGGLDTKMEKDSIRINKEVFKSLTGKDLPTKYFSD